MKLKVCGMKYIENIQQVADLKPDYLAEGWSRDLIIQEIFT